MGCFIKKILQDRADEEVHKHFVRFGKGEYKGRAALSIWKTSKIRVGGGFDYANDFVLLASEFNVKFSGLISSKEPLGLEGERKKAGLFVYEVSNLGKEKIREIANKSYYMLLDGEGEVSLKIKKKLPKLGKSGEAKVDDKFCVLEADLKFWPRIKEAFCWDVEGKKIKIKHTYIITDLIMPKDEKDFAVIREKTRRKGKIIRKIEVDGKEEQVREKEFEV